MSSSHQVADLRLRTRHLLSETVHEERWDADAGIWELLGISYGVGCQITWGAGVWVVGISPGWLITEVNQSADLIERFLAVFDRSPAFLVNNRLGPIPVGQWIEVGDVVLSYDGPTVVDRFVERLPGYRRRTEPIGRA